MQFFESFLELFEGSFDLLIFTVWNPVRFRDIEFRIVLVEVVVVFVFVEGTKTDSQPDVSV